MQPTHNTNFVVTSVRMGVGNHTAAIEAAKALLKRDVHYAKPVLRVLFAVAMGWGNHPSVVEMADSIR